MSATKKKVLIYSLIGAFLAICIACFCCIKFIKFGTASLIINCKDSVILSVGESYPLDIECSQKDAEIKLTTENREIIQIQDNNITALSSGTAIVKINAESEGVVGSKNIKVVVEDDDIDLGVTLPRETTIYVIDKMSKEAERNGVYNFVRFSTNKDVSYALSNPNVISLSKANGKITAISEGKATVTFFSAANPAVKSVHTVIVKNVNPSLNLSTREEVVLDIDESTEIKYSISPVYYTGKAEVSISVEDPEIAKVEGNVITAVRSGETQVNISLNGTVVKEIKVKVKQPYIPVYSFEIVALDGATVTGKTIYLSGDSCLINIKVINDRGEYYNDPRITIVGAKFKNIGRGLHLTDFTGNNLLIKVESIGLSEIYTLVMQS